LIFYVDIEDAAGNKVGSGPITSASSWRVRALMDGAGEWSFTAPLSDVKMAQATPRRYGHIYAWLAGAYAWVGGGPIDSIRTEIGDDGIVMATVGGGDLIRELAWRSVGSLALSDGAGGPMTHSQAVAAVAAFAPAGWTITADASPANNNIYGQFGGESVLAALATLADRSGSHFMITGRRTLAFVSTATASGVHAVAAGDDLGTGQCAIVAMGLESSSYDLYSRIIPVGAGQSLTSLTLRATTRTAASGYTLDATTNYLRNDGVETAYGRCELVVSFKDIAPISSTTADVLSAANMLYDAALAWLDAHAAPLVTYKLSVAECPVLLRPLQSIRVSYQNVASNIDIDDALIVLAVDWSGDTAGVRTAGLTVSAVDAWPDSDLAALVEGVANGNVYQAHPQVNVTHYVIPYSETVDQTETAEFWWRFDEHITQLVRVTFDFEIKALESTVKTIALEQETGGTISTSYTGNSGASGAASTGAPSSDTSGAPSNNTSGAPSNDTSGGPSQTNSGAPSNDTSGTPSQTNSGTPSNDTSGTPSDNQSDGSGTLETTGATNVSGGGGWGSGSHRHDINIADIGNPSGSPVYIYVTGGTYYFGAPMGGVGQQKVRSDFIDNHHHGLDSHTHSLKNHTHGLNNHTHSLNSHTHTLNNHTHTLNSHTHSLNSHTHTLGSHTHTLGSHTHTITHTHDISHTHTFTAAITTLYGIFRDVAANTFALTDLEYSLDGATWYGFAVGVNGYTTLGDNRHRVDLTALLQNSTTLRPLAANNLLRIRRKSTGATGKAATIKAQLVVVPTVQALALS